MPAFRVNASRFLLTYPRTTSTPQLLYEFLNSIKHVNKAIICREAHQDGEEHLHAAVEFASRVNSVNVSIFDFSGRHPNIEVSRSWAACVNYCRKDGTIQVEYFGCDPEDATVADAPRARDGPSGAEAYDACDAAATIKAWFTWCIDHNLPYAYANSMWVQQHGKQPPTYFANDHGGIIVDLHLQALQWSADYHCLVICGPSGAGKTSWALANAPVPFLLVTDIDDLGFFDSAVHKCIVFDEVRCTGDRDGKGCWPLTSQIKLCTFDTPVSIRVRYKIAHIPKNVHKIITSTDTFPLTGDRQIRRRVHDVNLYGGPNDRYWLL